VSPQLITPTRTARASLLAIATLALCAVVMPPASAGGTTTERGASGGSHASRQASPERRLTTGRPLDLDRVTPRDVYPGIEQINPTYKPYVGDRRALLNCYQCLRPMYDLMTGKPATRAPLANNAWVKYLFLRDNQQALAELEALAGDTFKPVKDWSGVETLLHRHGPGAIAAVIGTIPYGQRVNRTHAFLAENRGGQIIAVDGQSKGDGWVVPSEFIGFEVLMLPERAKPVPAT
jgi:hypothetical protein